MKERLKKSPAPDEEILEDPSQFLTPSARDVSRILKWPRKQQRLGDTMAGLRQGAFQFLLTGPIQHLIYSLLKYNYVI